MEMLLDKQVSVIFLFECKMGCKAQETTHNINTFGPKHHFEVSSSLILCNNKELILEWIVTCDEKGINKLQRTSHSQTCTVKSHVPCLRVCWESDPPQLSESCETIAFEK